MFSVQPQATSTSALFTFAVTPSGPTFVMVPSTASFSFTFGFFAGHASTKAVTDFSTDPFRADYRDRDGERRPAPPTDQRFWAASAHGSGPQELTWDVEDGDWSVVVMNADASREVAATIRAGTKVPFLAPAGWISIGAGLVLLTVAGVLVLATVRRD